MVRKINGNSDNSLASECNGKIEIFERATVEYEDLSVSLVQGTNDFSKQFAHIYAARLAELRDVLMEAINVRWKNIPIAKLADLEDLNGQRCILIGTLYKHQPCKPSILRELSEDHELTPPVTKSDYCSDKDQAFLEDEMLRIKLAGEQVHMENIITGIVCAILGNEENDGTFLVKDWCFPGCAPAVPVPTPTTKGRVVLISGIDFTHDRNDLALHLLAEWICGMAGDTAFQKEETSIIRVIISGNIIHNKTIESSQKGHSEGKIQDNVITKEIIAATKNADDFFSKIAKCCCVTLIPGQHDPTNVMLPQKPLHPCLLPKSSRLGSFQSACNPWIGKVGERIIMGTSGQPIENIMKVSGAVNTSAIEWLEKTIIWRHMCPTAPDTLPIHPYCKKDPLIIKKRPDIYFVGNASKYETKLWKGDQNETIRLISIPQFSVSHAAVITDLISFNTELISFGAE